MEACFTEAVTGLSNCCLHGNPTKLQEDVFLATVALLCVQNKRKSDILSMLRSLSRQSLTVSGSLLKDNISTPSLVTPSHTHTDKFWSTTQHLITLTSPVSNQLRSFLHKLQRFHRYSKNMLSVYSALSSHVLSRDKSIEFLHGNLEEIMSQLDNITPDQCDQSFQSFIQTVSVCYIHTDLAHTQSSKRECVHTALSLYGPKAVHKAYTECLLQQHTEGSGVLKSVQVLTDCLLLLATVAKGTKPLQDVTIETILRLFNHCMEQLVQLYKSFPKDLSLKSLYVVFGSALHLHSAFTEYLTLLDFQIHDYSIHFSSNLSEFCDELRRQIVTYHVCLCQTSLLQDKESHDWTSNQPFFEGERCSFSVQMWHYHMLGLEHDLRTLLLEISVSMTILHEVLSATISFLAGRYSKVIPSYRRTKQLRGDILAILLTASMFTDNKSSDHCSVIHASCMSLVQTMTLTLSPLTDLKDYLKNDYTQTTQQSTGDWLKFLEICGFSHPSCTSINGHSRCVQSHACSNGTEVSVHSYQAYTDSWPNLLQALLSNEASLAQQLCSRSDHMIPHMVTVLSLCYHSPCALSHVYKTWRLVHKESLEENRLFPEPGNDDVFLQSVVDMLVDVLHENVLLGAVRIHCGADDNAGPAMLEIINELVDQVFSQLSSPLIKFIETLADIGEGEMSHAQRVAKVLGTILYSWLSLLLPKLSDPLTSVIATYSVVLKHTLLGTLLEQGHSDLDSLSRQLVQSLRQHAPKLLDVIGRFETLSSPHMSIKDVVTLDEHEMAAEIMETNMNALQSLRAIRDYLSTPSHHTHITPSNHTPKFNPTAIYRNIGGVPMATIMDKADDLQWKDLLKAVPLCHMTRERVTTLVARRWEFQERNVSLLNESEDEHVQTITTILHDNSSGDD